MQAWKVIWLENMDSENSFGWRGTLFSIFLWLVIGFSIILAITFKSEIISFFQKTKIIEVISRVSSEIYPSKAFITDTGEVRINKGTNNYFEVKGKVNKESILFLVDTGATITALTIKDAAKVGINTNRLKFKIPIETANGTTYAAVVQTKSREIGDIQFQDFNVFVGQNLSVSLLGMDFISKLSKFEIEDNVLILSNWFTDYAENIFLALLKEQSFRLYDKQITLQKFMMSANIGNFGKVFLVDEESEKQIVSKMANN